MQESILCKWGKVCLLASASFLIAYPAQAATMWTDWTATSAGASGSATGTLGSVGVSYSGEVAGAVTNGVSNIWAPVSSFTGGTSTVSPSVVGDDIRLIGNTGGTNTLTFDSAVENPVFAIWSLGSPSVQASFTFDITPTFEAGGANSLFGGSPIVVVGNVVSGREGNGVVQFTGSFSSISWTNTPENYYAFTVGLNGPLGPEPPTAVPEPTTLTLTALGLGLVGLVSKRRLSC